MCEVQSSLYIRANVNQGKIWEGRQGARSSVGTRSKWESRLCLLPRDAASIPSSLKGIQKEEREAGKRGMGGEGAWLGSESQPMSFAGFK